jgi:hypothetical protein
MTSSPALSTQVILIKIRCFGIIGQYRRSKEGIKKRVLTFLVKFVGLSDSKCGLTAVREGISAFARRSMLNTKQKRARPGRRKPLYCTYVVNFLAVTRVYARPGPDIFRTVEIMEPVHVSNTYR